MRDGMQSGMAVRLHNQGVPLGEIFSFISGLYFRGKLAYARAFAAPPLNLPSSQIITAAAGLMTPDRPVTLDQR